MPTKSRPAPPAPFEPPARVLLGPGPSDVHPRVREAMAKPLIGHLDPVFVGLMDETQELLRYAFQTENKLTLAVSGTGSAGMETIVVNLIEPGDPMLVCVNGIFGARMVDVAERARAKVTTIERPYGETFDPDEIRRALKAHPAKVVGIVQAETSTGAWQPLEEIAEIVHEAGALLAVDAVTSLAGVPLEVDAWEIDAVYSGTQKCLSCPPGLAPVTLGARAVETLAARKTKVQSWYLDLSMIMRYWGSDRFYHHTAPISMNYALREALALVAKEGLEARHARHALCGQALQTGLAAISIGLATRAGNRLPQLTCALIPDGVDDLAVRKRLLADWGIEVGGGLGPWKGKVWRIGLMGHGARASNVTLFLSALETCLRDLGVDVPVDASVKAASAVLEQTGQPVSV